MSRKSKKKRTNKIDLSKGLWIKTAEGRYIGVKKKKITAESIRPRPPIRYGLEAEDGKIELVEGRSFPVFDPGPTENEHWTVEKVIDKLSENGLPPTAIYTNDEQGEAEKKFRILMSGVLTLLEDLPLDTYKRGYIDRNRNRVDNDLVWKYQVKAVEDDGTEILEEFPYLESTHVIEEVTEDGPRVWPRIYYDMFLGESYYELYAKTDADRFMEYNLGEKLDNYPLPVLDDQGNPLLDGDGNPMIKHEEVMLVYEGYCAQSGSSQQYHALITHERIQSEGEEKFVLVMKLTQTKFEFANAMKVPSPEEVPRTTTRKQKPIIMEDFASQIAGAVAKAT